MTYRIRRKKVTASLPSLRAYSLDSSDHDNTKRYIREFDGRNKLAAVPYYFGQPPNATPQ